MPGIDQIRDPVGNGPGLAGAGSGEHAQRTARGEHGCLLLKIQPVQHRRVRPWPASSQTAPTFTGCRGRILVTMPAKQDKETEKAVAKARRAQRKAKRGQIFEAFKMQRREDKALLPS